jgi:hypothetical protein
MSYTRLTVYASLRMTGLISLIALIMYRVLIFDCLQLLAVHTQFVALYTLLLGEI